MAQYQHTALEEFRQEVANSLGDTGMVFWTANEIDSYIQEALYTFGAVSGFWKKRFFVSLVENKTLYNLFTDTTDSARIAPSLTYQDVINWVSRDIMESIPSSLLTASDILELIEARYNKFQLLTGLVLSVNSIDIVAQNNLYNLSDDIIEIIRLKFDDSQDNIIVLHKEDEVELSYFAESKLLTEGLPEYYSTVYGSPNELNIYPMPNNSGEMEVISVNNQSTPVTVDTIINLPNNLVPYIKFGVEADIFNKEGLLNNVDCAKYCEERWKEGIFLGKNYTSILNSKVNGVPIHSDSLFTNNLYTSLKKTRDVPNVLGLAGFNIVEVDIIPADEQHSLELVCQHNAPIPTLALDTIDIEIGYVDVILAYIVHIAQMKCGPEELNNSISSRETFIEMGLAHNERLQLKGISFEEIVGRAKKEERDNPKIPVTQNA